MKLASLRRDEKGASALEFALAAPAMLMFVMGIAQLGMLCMADAGLKSAVAEGARLAVIYRTPPVVEEDVDAEIIARVNEAAWGMQAEHIVAPTVVRDEDGEFLDISMSYSAPLNFAFIELDPVMLTETRRVFLQADSPSGSSGGGSSASGSSTGGSSTGGSPTSSGNDDGNGNDGGDDNDNDNDNGNGNSNGNGNGHGHGNGNGNGH